MIELTPRVGSALNPNNNIPVESTTQEQSITAPNPFQKSCGLILPNFQINSFTFSVFLASGLVWICELIAAKTWNSQWNCVLFIFGAKYQPAITLHFDIWRLLSSSLIFKSGTMFAANCLALNLMGYNLQRQNRYHMILIYAVCIVFGNLSSCIWQPPQYLSCGLSCGTIGLFPVQLHRHFMEPTSLRQKKKLVLLVFNFFINLSLNIESFIGTNQIDWVSHIGALACGIFLVLVLKDYKLYPTFFQKNQKLIRILVLVSLVSAFFSQIFYVFIYESITKKGFAQYNTFLAGCGYSN